MPYTPDPLDPSKLSERELLLILHERIGTMGRELHELKDSYSQRLGAVETKLEHLQTDKADWAAVTVANDKQVAINDARTAQINKINNRLAFAAGGLAVLQILLGLWGKFGWPHS